MQISYNILKDFVKLPKSISAQEIALKLTDHTVEVEKVLNQADNFLNVVVGKVLKVEKHPKADRLNLAEIDIKTEKLKIVCGAPNLEVGQLVPVAKIGAVLPGEFIIKESDIRGEKSMGMICAEDELGLGLGHEGIMVLNKQAKIGQNFSDYLKTNDIIFEIDNKSLSNRPDLLNHYGIARELAAIFSLELKDYQSFIKEINWPQVDNKIEVKIEEKDLCLRYLAIKIENIKIKESPEWLKNRLIAIGQKPINNIVDIGNYVMFEMGQPVHAFDASKVTKINVRLATQNEKVETLDGKERVLTENNLLISDDSNILAVAGVIGAQDSAVNDKTTAIILESANFKDAAIRKSSQKLGLRTESSIRFEKALDTDLPMLALKRFITILLELLPEAQISSQLTEINNFKEKENLIDLSFSWLENKIGQKIEKIKVLKQLNLLGFVITNKDEDNFTVKVPIWRSTKDIKLKEDILEEVLRLYGYNNIKSQLIEESFGLPQVNEQRLFERKIKDFFVLKHSLFEVYNYSFVGEEQLKKLEIDFLNHLKLVNPLSENHTLLRQSLVSNLILNIKHNQFKTDKLGLFEIGSVFFNTPGNLKKVGDYDEAVLPYQESRLGIVLSENEEHLYLKAKGLVESLLNFITKNSVEINFLPAENMPLWCEKNSSAAIFVLDNKIGLVSILKKEISNKFNLKKKTVFVEINMEDLFKLYQRFSRPNFKEPAKYPLVIRDLAFVIDEEILYNDIKKEIVNYSDLIKHVELFDVYQGDKLDGGKKSLAFHIHYLSPEKTLTTAEVDDVQNSLIKYLAEKFSAKLRDF